VQYQQRVNVYQSTKTAHEVRLKQLNTALDTATATLTKELARRGSRPAEHEWEKMLEHYNIVFQQHYTMTLVGEHIHRMLHNHSAILRDTREMMVRRAALLDISAEKQSALCEDIRVLMEHMEELMDSFDFLVSLMGTQTILDDKAIDRFGEVARYFGQIYRAYLDKDGTPKVHLLETHVVDYLRRYKRLGLFGEDMIEREHHLNKVYNALFKNVRNWFEKAKLVQRVKAVRNSQEVQCVTEQVRLGTARKHSQVTNDKRESKLNSQNDVKKQRLSAEDKTWWPKCVAANTTIDTTS
jgi:hypothetical protein